MADYCKEYLCNKDGIIKNAMLDSLQLFDDLIKTKWCFKRKFIVFFTKEDLFRQFVLKGKQMKDCFNHANCNFNNFYNINCEYNDIEWNPNINFEKTYEFGYTRTAEQNADMYFEDVIHTQFDFIQNIIFQIAKMNGHTSSSSIYCHVVTFTDRDNFRRLEDFILHQFFMSWHSI